MTLVGFAAALAAMLANTAASLLEAQGSRRVSPGRPQWRQPRYLAGIAFDGLGWVLSVAALRVLPVFAVQSVLGGTVPVTAAAAGRGSGRLPRPRMAAIAGVLLGLGLVAASAAPGRAERLPPAAHPVLLGLAALLLALLVPLRRSGRPVPMTVAAGAAFGGVSLAVRAVHIASTPWTSVLDLLTEPLAYAVVALGGTGTVLLAGAMRAGAVGTVVAVLTVTEVIGPGLLGLALLGDRVRPGWLPLLVTGWLLAVAGVAVLARLPAGRSMRPA